MYFIRYDIQKKCQFDIGIEESMKCLFVLYFYRLASAESRFMIKFPIHSWIGGFPVKVVFFVFICMASDNSEAVLV